MHAPLESHVDYFGNLHRAMTLKPLLWNLAHSHDSETLVWNAAHSHDSETRHRQLHRKQRSINFAFILVIVRYRILFEHLHVFESCGQHPFHYKPFVTWWVLWLVSGRPSSLSQTLFTLVLNLRLVDVDAKAEYFFFNYTSMLTRTDKKVAGKRVSQIATTVPIYIQIA